ncbi:MAG TPA: hypothetical protein VK915_13430 [Gaiellaceae bacterium]|nr:hypothetical protein [Gaiellaceae bacterium]
MRDDRFQRRARALPATVLAAALLGAAACSSGEAETPAADEAPGQTSSAPEPATTGTEIATTEEATEPPVTAVERRWRRSVERYEKRLERQILLGGIVTHASMRRDARVFADCPRMLEDAGDPGRYAPAARIVERACTRLAKAKRLLLQALDATDAGGAVVAGTPEEDIFDRAFPGAIEASGNGHYDLQRALERARRIADEIESQQ